MATYAVDTSTVSFMMREDEAVVKRLHSLGSSDQLICCPIVKGEIEFGIKDLPESKRRRQLAKKARTLLAAFEFKEITSVTADYYANLKCAVKRAGRMLSDNDLWIAAVALENNSTLVAADNDYSPLAWLVGLPVEDWTSPI